MKPARMLGELKLFGLLGLMANIWTLAKSTPFSGLSERILCRKAIDYTDTNSHAQKGDSPFKVTTNQTKYIPGQTLTVEISGTQPHRAVLLQARLYGKITTTGHFLKAPSGGALYNCKGINSTVAIWYDSPQDSSYYTWSSTSDVGPVHFIATIFTDEKTYWTNVTSRRFKHGFNTIDMSTCGTEKGCYRYSKSLSGVCTGHTCDYLITYLVQGNEAKFEMSARAGWVAIGFSSDEKMGGTDVMMCITLGPAGDVRHYYNEYEHNPPTLLDNNPLRDQQADVSEDGRISCRFWRPLKIMQDEHSIDLNNDWFQLYAWGEMSEGGNPLRHTILPPTSKNKVTLSHKRNVIINGCSTLQLSSLPTMCIIMFVALTYCLPTDALHKHIHQFLYC